MSFEQAHAAFIGSHLARRKGERRGRLERGHGHGEKLFLENVWWPLKGNFDRLHPEYEVLDWRGKSYFGDFLYVTTSGHKFIWEIKGFNTHVKELDRQGFCKECKRELFLEGLAVHLVSFAYDDVKDEPDLLIALLRMVLSQYESGSLPELRSFAEKEVIRLAHFLARPIRPKDVVDRLHMNFRRAVRILQSLTEQGWFRAIKGEDGVRVVKYELIRMTGW
ncbi:hypothetical protein SD71_06865 [Cohnella kolymensis]|uniref:NERD domain-containing protein n=1 Tax=Cohnella kolymensis TaxID=1590652 RepID=A0ABR5A7C7_9BACL|nr:hypothetical protein [Cohnella kolymensis]KIL36713.1 hypothetical protein SD71_06865 [Cohnella kolymensis]